MSQETPNAGDPDAPPPEPAGFAPGELYRVAWIFYLVLAVAGVVWLGLANDRPALEVFLDPAAVLLDLALGVGCAGLMVGGWRLLRRTMSAMRRLEELMRPWFTSLDGSEIFALALLSGFAEELFFRGAMQSSLGWIWATLIFTLLHSGPGRVYLVWTAFAGVAGLVFAALTLWRENILAAMVAHFLVNWINLSGLVKESGELLD